MFLFPAASQGQSLPSAVLMKTCLKPQLNQHQMRTEADPDVFKQKDSEAQQEFKQKWE